MRKFARKIDFEDFMKKYFKVICLLFLGALLTTSCLSSDTEVTTVITSDDAVITSFTLGNLNQYGKTKTGKDTLYRSAITGSNYKISIDQEKNEVYNVKLLPYKTDLSKVVCNVGTLNNGLVYVEKINDPEVITLVSTSDSLDFSNGYRWMRIYAADGSVYRRYKVTLTARDKSTDFEWTEVSPEDPSIPGAINHEVTIEKEGDGFKLTYDGVTTTEELGEDENINFLPVNNLAMVTWPLESNDDTLYKLLVGTIGENTDKCMVWRKIEGYVGGDKYGQWVQVELAKGNKNFLPAMTNISLLYFEGVVIAVGSDGFLYTSVDEGTNWRKDGRFAKPEGAGDHLSIIAEGDVLWLKDLDANRVWKGIVYEQD